MKQFTIVIWRACRWSASIATHQRQDPAGLARRVVIELGPTMFVREDEMNHVYWNNFVNYVRYVQQHYALVY